MMLSIYVLFWLFVLLILIVIVSVYFICFFFFKQKTAYEMRISDWSSDVCSSDLSCSAGGFFLGYTIRSYATESYMIGSYIAVTSSCPGRVAGSAPAHR